MADTCKATITFGDVKIVLEGPTEFIEEQIEKYSTSSASKKGNKNLVDQTELADRGSAALTERDLIGEKQPKGHHEIIAVLAFALRSAGEEEFGEDEIRRAYIRAGVRPPKVVGQALRDAKRSHDFLVAVGRGRYQLSPHGERTVIFDLPRRGDGQ